MSIKQRMQGAKPSAGFAADPLERIYREERAFRADRLSEKWARVPELGKGLEKMDDVTRRNTVILLENQARTMSHMTEAQISTNFHG